MTEPWVRFEDEHLLVVTKPAGVNTHRADPVGQDGMHEWVQRQRPSVSLSILHRLDKATSGLLVFGKTALANQALTEQFADRTVAKRYELLVDADPRRAPTARCDEPLTSGSRPAVSRPPGPRASGSRASGSRASGPPPAGTQGDRSGSGTRDRRSGVPSDGRSSAAGPPSRRGGVSVSQDRELLEAVTDFERRAAGARVERWDAHPRTGRTHQVRVHAAALGLPILGDTEHGGGPAARLFLHAASLAFDHPVSGASTLDAPRPASFDRVLGGAAPDDPAVAALAAFEARAVLFDPTDTDAYLWIDRSHDGFDGVRVERLGDVAVVRSYDAAGEPVPAAWLDAWADTLELRAIYEQRRPRGGGAEPARLVRGRAGERFAVTELGCRYLIDLAASATSTGLFLDQRETRRRLLATDLAGRTVLNAFAHTGSLSVAAARAGAETLTLDLSTRYLDWARDNLRANDLDPADHDFIYGDALEWMARLAKKGRTFDVVLVDPPSSSTPKKKGTKRWVVERDLAELVERSIELCAPGGTVFVSTNLHRMRWPRFLEHVDVALLASGRSGRVETQTLPLDHRTGPGDPPYLKAAWIHLDG